MYGQSFSLADTSVNGLNAATYGKGEAGRFTMAGGFLAYYEICDNIQSGGWTVVKDPKKRMGPYAYKGSQWVSFDDAEMIRYKSEYIRHMGLGGGMIWALDLDDFRNRCSCEKHPLLRTINRVLRQEPETSSDCDVGGTVVQATEPPPPPPPGSPEAIAAAAATTTTTPKPPPQMPTVSETTPVYIYGVQKYEYVELSKLVGGGPTPTFDSASMLRRIYPERPTHDSFVFISAFQLSLSSNVASVCINGMPNVFIESACFSDWPLVTQWCHALPERWFVQASGRVPSSRRL